MTTHTPDQTVYQQPQQQIQQEMQQLEAQPGPRTLHIYSEGAFSRTYTAIDTDKQTLLYTIELHSGTKPHITVQTAATGTNQAKETGTATFRSLSSSIDMTVHGQSIQFERNGAFSSGHQWHSPAMCGRLLKWKTEGAFTSDKTCFVDDDKTHILARWERSTMARTKLGKLHVLDPNLGGPGSPAFDEIVVSGIVEMEAVRRRSRNNDSGGSAADGTGTIGNALM